MINPFESYISKSRPADERMDGADDDKTSQVYAERIFFPDIRIHYSEAKDSAYAFINRLSFKLYDAKDFLSLSSTYVTRDDTFYQMRGLLGERFLSIVLEHFLNETKNRMPQTKSCGVIREDPRHTGKGFVMRSSDEYILRHKNEINMVVLSKDTSVKTDEAIYMQEKHGFHSTEIDGMGYFHFNGKMYLVVGEVTTRNDFALTSWDNENHRNIPVEDRVFNPLKSLFPQHDLIYAVMARKPLLWDAKSSSPRLLDAPAKVHKRLEKIGVNSIFLPLPETKPTLEDIAWMMSDRIPFLKKIIAKLD